MQFRVYVYQIGADTAKRCETTSTMADVARYTMYLPKGHFALVDAFDRQLTGNQWRFSLSIVGQGILTRSKCRCTGSIVAPNFDNMKAELSKVRERYCKAIRSLYSKDQVDILDRDLWQVAYDCDYPNDVQGKIFDTLLNELN